MFDRILKFVKPKETNTLDKNYNSKISILNFVSAVTFLLSFIFGIYHLIINDTRLAYILLSYSILFALIILLLKKTKSFKNNTLISTISIVVLLFFLIVSGKSDNTGLLWALGFPSFAVYIFNQRKGLIYSLLFIGAIAIYFLIPENSIENLAVYKTLPKIQFVLAYSAFLFISILYKRLQSNKLNSIEKELLEANKTLKEKNNFISNLSFRIRTPLNNIVGILNLKYESLEKDVITEIELSINNLITIVNSIPEFSESKLQFLKSENIFFSLNSAVKESFNLYKNDDFSNLKFTINISNKIPAQMFGNMLVVKQIIVSIIDFFYKNNNGKQTKIDFIITEKENQQHDNKFILFKIKSNIKIDSFKGFEDENSFTDISQIDNHELPVIQSLIESIDGKLNVFYDGDTVAFLFSLPFTETEQKTNITETKNTDDTTTEPVETVQHQSINLSEANVLLVEDDKVNQKIMVMTLRKYIENIDVAENGKEALIKFGKTKYDIILMDIRMPLMDGYKTTMKIREAEAGTNSKIPIIAVTANALSGDREKCLEAGMDEYISKPFNKKELLAKMEELLS
jgi:CheY-like chemotaxis protein/signal transduction histidine kinase